MSYITQVSITVQVSGGKTETYTFPNAGYPYPPQLTTSPATDFQYVLVPGTLVNVPSGALYMLVVPAPGNTGTIVLKGVSGDTGFAINAQNPSLLSLPSGDTSVCVVSGSTANVEIMFF